MIILGRERIPVRPRIGQADIGEVLDEIEKLGISDNTIVIVMRGQRTHETRHPWVSKVSEPAYMMVLPPSLRKAMVRAAPASSAPAIRTSAPIPRAPAQAGQTHRLPPFSIVASRNSLTGW